jgi:hypothetical protein
MRFSFPSWRRSSPGALDQGASAGGLFLGSANADLGPISVVQRHYPLTSEGHRASAVVPDHKAANLARDPLRHTETSARLGDRSRVERAGNYVATSRSREKSRER